MALTLTPQALHSAYSYLAATKPFCDWSLPATDSISFEVVSGIAVHGYVQESEKRGGPLTLGISEEANQHTLTLMMTIAHEMVHLHLKQIQFRGWKNHGPRFRAIAAEVCAAHGFDPGPF